MAPGDVGRFLSVTCVPLTAAVLLPLGDVWKSAFSEGWKAVVLAPHSSALAWKIPRTEEPGGLQSMGSRRVGHD